MYLKMRQFQLSRYTDLSWYLNRISLIQTAQAEIILTYPYGVYQTLEAEIADGIGIQKFTDRFHTPIRCQQLISRWRVDTEITGCYYRGLPIRKCTSFAPFFFKKVTIRLDVVPLTMLSSTSTTCLPSTFRFTTFNFNLTAISR